MEPAPPVLVVRAGRYTLRGRPLCLGLPLPSVLSMTDPEGAGSIRTMRADLLLQPEAAPGQAGARNGRLLIISHVGRTGALLVDEVLGVEHAAHWAPADLLEPLDGAAFLGVVPNRDRWVAIVDPAAVT
jgi:hypothetical protein